MIRNLVLFSVKDGTPSAAVEAIAQAVQAIRFDGCRRWELVQDLGLREGNLPYTFVSEFDNEAAYRAYDGHGEHDRIRQALLAPIIEKLERFQYQVP